MHLEDILTQCLSLPGVSLTHDDHHATLQLVTEGGNGTIDFSRPLAGLHPCLYPRRSATLACAEASENKRWRPSAAGL